ncbi:hypothetical protein ACMFMG_002361 [Clarireedia jacksonii]
MMSDINEPVCISGNRAFEMNTYAGPKAHSPITTEDPAASDLASTKANLGYSQSTAIEMSDDDMERQQKYPVPEKSLYRVACPYYLVEDAVIWQHGRKAETDSYMGNAEYWRKSVKKVSAARRAQNVELGLLTGKVPRHAGKALWERYKFLQKRHEYGILVLDDRDRLVGFREGQKMSSTVALVPHRRDLGLSWTEEEEAIWDRYLGTPEKIANGFLVAPDEEEGSKKFVADMSREINWEAVLPLFPDRTVEMLKAHRRKRLGLNAVEAPTGSRTCWTTEEEIRLCELLQEEISWQQMATDPLFIATRRSEHAISSRVYSHNLHKLDSKQLEQMLEALKERRESEGEDDGEDSEDDEEAETCMGYASELEQGKDFESASSSSGELTPPHLRPTYPWETRE